MQPDFLTRMAAASFTRAAEARAREPEQALKRRALSTPLPPVPKLSSDGFDLISEIKLMSPSSGGLAGVKTPGSIAERARIYARGGAAVISVLTEPASFGGSLEDLEEAAAAVPIPVMRKDFLVDPYQVWEARTRGAGGVLLIARMLERPQLDAMLAACGEAQLFALIEAFDEDDLDEAARAKAKHRGSPIWIGVNTRDLATLNVVPDRLEQLSIGIPLGSVAVAESGMRTPEDVSDAASLGYSLALVGGALMLSSDPGTLIERMIHAGRQATTRSREERRSLAAHANRSPRGEEFGEGRP